MDLDNIILTTEQAADLAGPFTRKHAQEAVLLGMARAFAENGLVPSQVERLLKEGTFNWGDALTEFPKSYALLGLGGGAVLGAYSGYARHRAEQMLDGNDNPEVVALKRKLQAYRSMTQDLKRTMAVSPTI